MAIKGEMRVAELKSKGFYETPRGRKGLRNHRSYLKKKGLDVPIAELRAKLERMRSMLDGISCPVLSSWDGSWSLKSLIWKERGTKENPKGCRKCGERWYVRGLNRESFATEAEAVERARNFREGRAAIGGPIHIRQEVEHGFDQTDTRSTW